MRLSSRRLGKAQPNLATILFLGIFIVACVSAQRTDDRPAEATADAAQTTDDPSTTDSIPSVTDTTAATTDPTSATSASENTTTSTSKSSETSTTMDSTTETSSSETSSTTDSSTTTSSVSTTTTSTSSSTSTAAPIVTVPPTAGAPYLETTNTPEGTVFIAVGAILGLIGLAVLAWRGMVAWSVNRSVRRAAMATSSEPKRIMRDRKKRSAVYTAAPSGDVSLDKLGAATRASYKPSKRVPSSNSGLFFSPTAGGAGVAGSGSHASLHTPGNRGSGYLPAGYYAAAGSSTPVRESGGAPPMRYSPAGGMTSPGDYPPSSPTLPPIGTYYDAPHNPRHSYLGTSTSSLNLNQPPQGRAPSAYLEDLFESHTSPRESESGRRDR
ncbi:hypothetical protein N7492_003711 [Penicillium capsulatum]|uniref:Uncharacterized protein n=1 Tax=Penicillium capsulatum TaxID=69766 RepID=A0A9W9INK8_9EURO|nr:hypothetical protein N7492_003711 [Penicillium capsulatum]KAJ6121708.1 hypothetical protein N7512_004173 [Penicillium capsulatum]